MLGSIQPKQQKANTIERPCADVQGRLSVSREEQMQLIITEKPSVAITIAKVLGITRRRNGYIEGPNLIISWCIGHLVEIMSI